MAPRAGRACCVEARSPSEQAERTLYPGQSSSGLTRPSGVRPLLESRSIAPCCLSEPSAGSGSARCGAPPAATAARSFSPAAAPRKTASAPLSVFI
jgi:hypothetical protein